MDEPKRAGTPLPGEEPRIKGRTRQVKREDWPIVLLDAHPGYITWEQFRRNQQVWMTIGPGDQRNDGERYVKEHRHCCQGIVLCGVCGRRMNVRYHVRWQHSQLRMQAGPRTTGREDLPNDARRWHRPGSCSMFLGSDPARSAGRFTLHARSTGGSCQADRSAVATPTGTSAVRGGPGSSSLQAVDPDNRLVARSLERDWNEKLTEVEQLQREYATLPKPTALHHHTPGATTDPGTRPKCACCLDCPDNHTSRAQAVTPLSDQRCDAHQAGARHRGAYSLANRSTHRPDRSPSRSWWLMHAAPILRWSLGFANWLQPTRRRRSRRCSMKKGRKQDWEAASPRARWTGFGIAYDIPLDCPEGPGFCPSGQRGDGRYSALAAAELLNVNVSTIADWCNAGQLECVRAGTHGRDGLHSHQKSSQSCASQLSATGNDERSRQREQNMVQ